ncbi:ANL family adenylate-forming protein [Rubellimicrobium aerolatum]|uniref:Long-chain-fatty-acid--CoA ligase n=1 Tax=Rubellimicrobium aerolatum TaxID=490979 RepID=A0ABW0SC92_9RHOB|nr:fatty acid--CoA ligase family protein [Rubellimicrobium aerolatum]MBP1806043.1 acyl-CoA synthetase (AMP-forming)/AMP-acid ligase II [Rubellimicrobium aerolatum]
MSVLARLVRDGVRVGGSVEVTAEALRATGPRRELASSRVALVLRDPVDVVRAVCALDGQVPAMLILSGATGAEAVSTLMRQAGCEALLTDREDLLARPGARRLEEALTPGRQAGAVATAWLMTTSGTTGLPKIVPHDLASLARTVKRRPAPGGAVWGLLYDPSRFAGMQVVLQALIGGDRLVVADPRLPFGEQVATLAAAGVTHLSMTPTLWRRLLMAPGRDALPLRQVTLGGEVADQPLLSALAAAYPRARISHIYASTEAGVGFSVTDGLAGFPEGYLDRAPDGVRLRLIDGMLWLKAPGAARGGPNLDMDEDGFVRTGDRLEVAAGRARFLGRDSGLINVGGAKVHPERVEAVLTAVPGVVMAKVTGRRSPMAGALVAAEVQLAPGLDPALARRTILDACRAHLEREAVPAILRFVDGFETNAAGKLVRTAQVEA